MILHATEVEKNRGEVRSGKDVIETEAQSCQRRDAGSPGIKEHKEVLAGNVDFLPRGGLYLKCDWRRNVSVSLGRQEVGKLRQSAQ